MSTPAFPSARALALAATPELKTALRNAAELAMHLPWEQPGGTIPFQHKQAFRDLATPEAILALLAEISDHERAYALLFKENAELRKDAERLDYLQNNARCDPKMDGNHVWWPTSFNQAQSLKGPTIREAIDAAKGESHEA
jgi:hypothetical protein